MCLCSCEAQNSRVEIIMREKKCCGAVIADFECNCTNDTDMAQMLVRIKLVIVV